MSSCDSGVLTASSFSTFFRDIHGHEPFPWQVRLTDQVIREESWPKVIDLPTGCGKTSVLDTAVFAMALKPEVSPRRVVFVIDRRIVVDQVHERAKRIRCGIEQGKSEVLRAIGARLKELGGREPLGVAALRGGIPIDNEWTSRPDQPWVLVSTVDQFGSRLLFRGYGVTPRMRPIHAGLAGNDCLVILDEVHLSVPFAETLSQVARLWPTELPRRFSIVEMSATPSNKDAERFTLEPATDLAGCEELRRRVQAEKRANLVSVQNRESIPTEVQRIVTSVNTSIQRSNAQVRSVGVVVNRLRTARETYEALAVKGVATHLITGRMRPLDRVTALENIGPVVDPDADRQDNQLTVVVATQAIEVGADFSFDALITECAPVDSLRQRFGRLDRRGTFSQRVERQAEAWIIGPKSELMSRKPDPVYGNSSKETWEELKKRAENGQIDVGSMYLRDFPEGATAPRAQAPLLLKTHMDAWAQTQPEPLIQPSIDWFLHGIDENRQADVSILWRWDRTKEALGLVPPRQVEFVQVPIAAVRSWLSGGQEVDIADTSQESDLDNSLHISNLSTGSDWVRWIGLGDDPEHISARDIRPGDVLIVDPERGGLRTGTWDQNSNEPVTDVGDAAQIAYGRRATLRLDPRCLDEGITPPDPVDEISHGTPLRGRSSAWLMALCEGFQGPDWLKQTASRLRDSGFDTTAVGIEDDNAHSGYYILTERHSSGMPVVDPATMDGSDESGSQTGTGVALSRHLDGVGNCASAIASRLGLPSTIIDDVRLAGRLHDIGKVDARFQLQLVGGDPVALELRKGEPLAKSLPGARNVWRYPRGMRHEVASVAMIESNLNVLNSAHDKDLVLHLVGTHHGFGRPLPPIIEDADPHDLSYTLDGHIMKTGSDLTETALALDMADRFWRLVERYGYHGLAWLEAILRLADHQQSAEEAKQA